jgi:hypothetical protein
VLVRHVKQADEVVWFFRAIEAADGTWTCRHGRAVFDEHPTLEQAIPHLYQLARDQAPFALVAHWYDGRVEWLSEARADPSSNEAPGSPRS